MDFEYNEEDSSEIVDKKIQAIYTINEEIIQRINDKANSNDELTTYEYRILPVDVESERHPYQFKVKEICTRIPCRQVVESWRVPLPAQLPEDPDPDETLYGKNKPLMDMTCQSFSDLVRINQQVAVAKKYTSMLRESISIQFGLKFKHNFEILQVLLGMLETQLQDTESTLQEKQEAIDRVNNQMGQLFAENVSVLSGLPCQFADFSKEAIMSTPYQINKGTLFSKGIHRWSVRCVNVVANYDLGVASTSNVLRQIGFGNGNVGGFGNSSLNGGGFSNLNSVWGIRQNGILFPAQTPNNTPFKTGDILSFVLDCTARTLTISINGRQAATIPDVLVPVHIAFSGGAQARAEIL